MAKIRLRRDTATNWANANPILALGEAGYDTTNNALRIGDGSTAWTGLTPIAGGSGNIGEFTFTGNVMGTMSGDIVIEPGQDVVFNLVGGERAIQLVDSREDGYDDPQTPSTLFIGNIWHSWGVMTIQSDGAIAPNDDLGNAIPTYGGLNLTNRDFSSSIFIPGPVGGQVGNISIKQGDYSIEYTRDGVTSFPNNIKVGGPGTGFITSVTSDNNYNYWFNSVAVDEDGNSYVVGGRDDQYLPIVISYDPAGNVRWKTTINRIDDSYNPSSLCIAVSGNNVSVSLNYYDGQSGQLGFVNLDTYTGAVLGSGKLETPNNASPTPYQTLFDGENITFVGSTGGDYTANVVATIPGSGNIVTGVDTVVFAANAMPTLVVPNGSQQWQINTSQSEPATWAGLSSVNAIDYVPLVTVTGGGSGLTAYVRWDNQRGIYDYVSIDTNYNLGSMGYANGDQVMIPGSWLGGVDGVNDVVGTLYNYWWQYWTISYAEGANSYGTCPPITYFVTNQGTDYTSANTWQVRVSNGGQGYITNGNFTHVYGTSDRWETIWGVVQDSNSNYYLATNYESQIDNSYYGSALIKLDSNGETVWAKFIEDANNLDGEIYSVGVDNQDNVYTIGYNGDGFAMVTKLTHDGVILWQSIQQESYWNDQPTGCVDSEGNVYLGGSYYNGDNYILSIMKLSGSDGSLVWSRTIRNTNNYDIYDFYDDFQQPFKVVGDFVYYGGYGYDKYNDYYDAFLVKVATDGTGLGTYGRYVYEEETNFNWHNNTQHATVVDFTSILNRTDAVTFTPAGLTVTTSTDDIGNGTVNVNSVIDGGVASVAGIEFLDGSKLESAGITRAASYEGDNTITLDATMNGKFLHYNGNWGNSTIYVPSDSDVVLPIGYSVTIVMDDFNGYYVYINNNNGDANINVVGKSPGTGNYWYLGDQGKTGIYNLLKVAPNRWILSGPDISVD